MPKGRHFRFTLNNYTDKEVRLIKESPSEATYLLFGFEVGPECGTPHLQGYVQFKGPLRFRTIKKWPGWSRVSFGKMKGSSDQNIANCKKGGEFYERGTPKIIGESCQRSKNGLTYSCPATFDEHPFITATTTSWKEACEMILQFLQQLHNDPGMQYIISRELHADGKSHFHVYYKLTHKMDITDPRAWDIQGVHPNILNPGKGWIDYVAKHGDFITNFYKPSLWERTKDLPVRQALELYEKEKPDMMLTQYERVLNNLNRRKRLLEFAWATPVRPDFVYKVAFPQLPEGNKSLHVYGKARCGKTQFILSSLVKKKVVLLSTHEQLGNTEIPWDEVEFVVFDDYAPVNHKRLSSDPQHVISLLDREAPRYVPARYKAVPNRHTLRFVFVSHERDIFYQDKVSPVVKNAIDELLVRYHVQFPLF